MGKLTSLSFKDAGRHGGGPKHSSLLGNDPADNVKDGLERKDTRIRGTSEEKPDVINSPANMSVVTKAGEVDAGWALGQQAEEAIALNKLPT